MEWLSNWIQGIIVAVIIGTIIEMILPQGNCKKYIKVVIGIYILFSIISPVITKVTGKDFRVSDIFDLDKYIEVSNDNMKSSTQMNQKNQIRELYITSLKNDMKEKVEAKGYEIKDIDLDISNDEQYILKNITIYILADKNDNGIKNNSETKNDNEIKSEIDNVEAIDKIKININTNINTNTTNNMTNQNYNENNSKTSSISKEKQQKLKEYLSSVYDIEVEKIHIK